MLFREPLKPLDPALAQFTTFPCGSATVMIVLLKVAWICTLPCDNVRLALRAPPRLALCPFRPISPKSSFLHARYPAREWKYFSIRCRVGGRIPTVGQSVVIFASTYFFFAPRLRPRPATVFFGPLRVRAFVRVRCPWTGSARRWRRPR